MSDGSFIQFDLFSDDSDFDVELKIDDLFDLFFDGSDSDVELKIDNFMVIYDCMTYISRFCFFGTTIASYDLRRRVLYVKPFFCRLTYEDSLRSSNAYYDFMVSIEIIQSIIFQVKNRGLIKFN